MSLHARLSPSSASRWIRCPGSVALIESLGFEEKDSEFAAEGTAAHDLARRALTDNDGRCEKYIDKMASNGWKITGPMAEDTQVYVDQVFDYAEGHALFVEQKVDFSQYIGVPDSFGTSDSIILTSDNKEIIVIDLKFGRGVEVYAEENEQMMLYALGALGSFQMLGDFERVRVVISQPRIGNLSEWVCTVDELLEFAQKARNSAQIAIKPKAFFSPGEKQCRFCRAKAICPAIGKKVIDEVGADFDDISKVEDIKQLIPHDEKLLAAKMNAVDIIEGWCKAVRGEVERILLGGYKVPGYKLVQGKQGNRKWTDEAAIEEVFKKMRLTTEQMYNLKLISPTDAEKLMAKDYPTRWKRVSALVTRTPGSPSVASEDDKRPALDIKSVEDDFAYLDAVVKAANKL